MRSEGAPDKVRTPVHPRTGWLPLPPSAGMNPSVAGRREKSLVNPVRGCDVSRLAGAQHLQQDQADVECADMNQEALENILSSVQGAAFRRSRSIEKRFAQPVRLVVSASSCHTCHAPADDFDRRAAVVPACLSSGACPPAPFPERRCEFRVTSPARKPRCYDNPCPRLTLQSPRPSAQNRSIRLTAQSSAAQSWRP